MNDSELKQLIRILIGLSPVFLLLVSTAYHLSVQSFRTHPVCVFSETEISVEARQQYLEALLQLVENTQKRKAIRAIKRIRDLGVEAVAILPRLEEMAEKHEDADIRDLIQDTIRELQSSQEESEVE